MTIEKDSSVAERLAILWAKVGDFKNTLKYIDKIKSKVTSSHTLLSVAEVFHENGNDVEALKMLQRAEKMISYTAETPARYNHVAVVQSKILGFKSAKHTFDKALLLTKKKNRHEFTIGKIYINMAQWQKDDIGKEKLTGLINSAIYFLKQSTDFVIDELVEKVLLLQIEIGDYEGAIKTAEGSTCYYQNRFKLLVKAAGAFAEKGEKNYLKKLILPSAHYPDSAAQMCIYLAELYPEYSNKIVNILCKQKMLD